MTSTVKHTPDSIFLGNDKQELRLSSLVGTEAEKHFGSDTEYLLATPARKSAPDLLEQLKWALWVLEDAKLEDVNLDITRAVIAKATGEQS